MSSQPTVGEVVAITTTDSAPPLLVYARGQESVEGVLLADLAAATQHRLQTTARDTPARRAVAHAVAQATGLMSFTVPVADCALIERDTSRPVPFDGGDD